MSCYAFFEWWLLLSQHPHCLRNSTSLLTLSVNLGALTGDQGLFPFCPVELSPHGLTAAFLTYGIRSLIGLMSLRPVQTFQCSTPIGNTRRQPKSCFGENQLLPSSISFSLQPTSHPRALHYSPVRASRHLSMTFILLMGSSPGFGSDTDDKRAIHARFHCGSVRTYLACRMHQLVGSFFNRHAVVGSLAGPLPLFVDIWFQNYFTPLTGVLFTFPSRYSALSVFESI